MTVNEILVSGMTDSEVTVCLNDLGYRLIVDDGYQICDGIISGCVEGYEETFDITEPGNFVVVSKLGCDDRYRHEHMHLEEFDEGTVHSLRNNANWRCDYGIE